jgi:hypothetical protein
VSENGVGVDFIRVNRQIYLRGSSPLLQHVGGSPFAQLLRGKWLEFPVSSRAVRELAAVTEITRY